MDVARSLPCGRYLLAPLTGSKEGSKSLVVSLLVKPTPTRFPTNSLYATDGQHAVVANLVHPLYLPEGGCRKPYLENIDPPTTSFWEIQRVD